MNIFRDVDGNGIWAAETYQTYFVFFTVTMITNTVSALANKWLPMLDVRFPVLLPTLIQSRQLFPETNS